MKYRIPMSLCELLKNSPRNTNMLLLVPLISLAYEKTILFFRLCNLIN